MDRILPHGSYLLNAGAADEEKLRKTRDTLIDEVKRCEMLGIRLYNFHPGLPVRPNFPSLFGKVSVAGSTVGELTVEQCVQRIAETINLVHEATSSVVLGQWLPILKNEVSEKL